MVEFNDRRSEEQRVLDFIGPAAPSDPNDDFGESSLSEEQRARYEGTREGSEHRERLKSMSPAARKAYKEALGEGISGAPPKPPRQGDAQNPRPQRQPRPPSARSQRAAIMGALPTLRRLARNAQGKKRR